MESSLYQLNYLNLIKTNSKDRLESLDLRINSLIEKIISSFPILIHSSIPTHEKIDISNLSNILSRCNDRMLTLDLQGLVSDGLISLEIPDIKMLDYVNVIKQDESVSTEYINLVNELQSKINIRQELNCEMERLELLNKFI